MADQPEEPSTEVQTNGVSHEDVNMSEESSAPAAPADVPPPADQPILPTPTATDPPQDTLQPAVPGLAPPQTVETSPPPQPQTPTASVTHPNGTTTPVTAQPPPNMPPAPRASPTRAGTPSGTTALPPSAIIPPANAHGSPTRVYLNSKVTPALLEGMKLLAANEPERPMRWLGEFLLRKSEESEGA